jgi:hypothetical protein
VVKHPSWRHLGAVICFAIILVNFPMVLPAGFIGSKNAHAQQVRSFVPDLEKLRENRRAIQHQIDNLIIPPGKFCWPRDRELINQTGQKLKSVEELVSTENKAYTDFRNFWLAQAKNTFEDREFQSRSMNPGDPSFWSVDTADHSRMVTSIGKKRTDFDLRMDQAGPCPGTATDGPKPREVVHRPPIKLPPFPVVPSNIEIPGQRRFCSPEERDAYIKATLNPLFDKINTGAAQLRDFEVELPGPLRNAEAELLVATNRPIKPADPAGGRVEIQRELDDINQKTYDISYWRTEARNLRSLLDLTRNEHARMNKLHDQLLAALNGLTVDPSVCPTANALGGLQRPVWEVPTLASPSFFCSEAERQKFIDQLTAAIKAANAAQGPVIDYRKQVNERQIALRGGKLVVGGVALQPADPAATTALQAESDWADAQLKRMRDAEDQLVKQRSDAYAIPIIDCSHTKVVEKRGGPGSHSLGSFSMVGGYAVNAGGAGYATGVDKSNGPGQFQVDNHPLGTSPGAGILGFRARLEIAELISSITGEGIKRTFNNIDCFFETGVQFGIGNSYDRSFSSVSNSFGNASTGWGNVSIHDNFQIPILFGLGGRITDKIQMPAFMDFYGGGRIVNFNQTIQGGQAGAAGFYGQQTFTQIEPMVGVGVRIPLGDGTWLVGVNVEGAWRQGTSVSASSPNLPSQTNYGSLEPRLEITGLARIGLRF